MGLAKSVGLIGHAGSGKTTLATALLKHAGVKDEITFDPSKEEQDRGHTIDMHFGSFEHKETRFTVFDTPGGDEFVEEMYKAVSVADLSLIVIHAVKGVEVMAERAWELTGASGRPAMLFVNHVDSENVNYASILAEFNERLGRVLVPLYLPIRENEKFVGLVDVLSRKAVRFGDKSKKDVPEYMEADLEQWRGVALEEISAVDDELMMKFLEDEEISHEELAKALTAGIASGAVIPVLFGAASEGYGVGTLATALSELTPVTVGSGSGPTRAVVFNLDNDAYLGRLSYVRVMDGTLHEGKGCVDTRSGSKVEIRDLYAIEGTKQHRVSEAAVGEVVAIGKAEDLQIGDTIAVGEAEPFEMIPFPKPVFSRTIVPKSQSDVEKMSAAIRELVTAKATVDLLRDPVTHEMILWGMGDVHLGLFLTRLKNRYNVTLETQRPRIPYKETIRKKAEAKYRHKKQSGGRGQFGEVELRIEPLKDKEYEFVDAIKGATIPGQYIPGVEKGVIEAMEEGNLAKFPVTHVLTTVFDGSYHPVDSSELAFKLAARNAFRNAFDQAGPVLLEPVMTIDVRAPEEFTGDVVSDLNGRRGRILGMEPMGRTTVVKAEVPLSEVQSYALDLKSLTQARGTFQMEFLRYQPVPGNVQEKVIAEAAARDSE